MSYAALNAYQAILSQGTQRELLNTMQTRDDLYDVLKYREYENKLDQFLENNDDQ